MVILNENLERALRNVVSDQQHEKDHWKATAIYLASCHAATFEGEGMMKSCPKSRKERYRSIVEKALAFLEQKVIPQHSEFEWTKDRLRKSLKETE